MSNEMIIPCSNWDSLNFLKAFHPEGPWAITAINPERNGRKTLTKTFYPGSENELLSFLEQFNGHWNLYFQPNKVRGAVSMKASREDIATVDCLYVDSDPRNNENIEAEQQRILNLFRTQQGTVPLPTCIVFSGGGYQAYWKLKEPLHINGLLEKAENAALYNKELERIYEGDHCHNVDRLMRLPGTINVPDEKKRKKGRVPLLSYVVEYHQDRTYDLDAFQIFKDSPTQSCAVTETFVGEPGPVPDLGRFELPSDINRIVIHGHDPENPVREGDNSRSGWLFSLICRLIMHGIPDEVIQAVITNTKYKISESVLEKPNPQKYAAHEIADAHKKVVGRPLVLSHKKPLEAARWFKKRNRNHLISHNGEWLDYDGRSYHEVEEATLAAELYAFLDKHLVFDPSSGKCVPYAPKKSHISDILHALAGLAHLRRDTFTPPAWLTDEPLPSNEIISCKNGLVHVPTGELLPHTPNFFTRNALEFAYDPNAPLPQKWFNFLALIWEQDRQSIATLQEIFGYLLIPDTSQQKVFMLVGPPRSGKGTIGRILNGLLGSANICSPSLNGLSNTFGLQPLIGKQLALISDMRIGPNTDHASITENLLRISGEDFITINRKYKTEWHGQLGTRFLIMTNELPRLKDSSTALVNRFVPLVMTKSFLGSENPNLSAELLSELPGILNWALEGWKRLAERGEFVIPQSSAEELRDLNDLTSPVSAFVRDMCDLEFKASISKKELFSAWQAWREDQGDNFGCNLEVFAKDLNSAFRGKIKSAKWSTPILESMCRV